MLHPMVHVVPIALGSLPHIYAVPFMSIVRLDGICWWMCNRSADQRSNHHQQHGDACPGVKPAVEDGKAHGPSLMEHGWK